MVMVLCVHFTGATFGLPHKMTLGDLNDISAVAKTLMESFSIIGVNCFVLISGYFGIKPTVKGLVNFTMWCLFYAVVIYAIYSVLEPKMYNVNDILCSIRVFSNTDLWFVPAYLALYLLAPIINRGTQSISRKDFIWLLVSLTFINIYLGWYWQGKVNPTGYNVMQMIYIYVIGRFLKQYIKPRKRYRIYFLLLYVISYIFLVASTFFLPNNIAYAYNSPFVVINSVSLFLLFSTLRIKNTYINHIASSAFAVYLLHKMPPVWTDLKEFMISNAKNVDDIVFSVYWVAFILLLFSSCIIIDKLRLAVMTPINKHIIRFINRFVYNNSK